MNRLRAAALFAAELIKAAWQGSVPCLFHLLTGAYCPGCGGTRAFKSLLRGRFLLSALYHPLVPYAAIAAPSLFLWYVYCRKKKKPFRQTCWKAALFVGAVLLGANFLVKNYLLFRGIDLPAILDQSASEVSATGWPFHTAP